MTHQATTVEYEYEQSANSRCGMSRKCIGRVTARQVPDPDEGMPEGERRYQIYLKSPAGPIDVYVVSQVGTCELFSFQEKEKVHI